MTKSLLVIRMAIVLILLALTPLIPVQAHELHVAGSYSTDQIRGTRIGYRWVNLSSRALDEWAWLKQPELHIEGAVNMWHTVNNRSDNILALTISPILSWQLSGGSRPLYLEAGIGASYLNHNQINGRGLSTGFQFEDRIGLSWQYSARSLERVTLSYVHYSNANIRRPNDGLDFITLTLTKPF